MKQILFLLTVLFILPEIHAQDLQVGIKTGVNLADLSGTVNENNKVKPGMILGGYIQVPMTNQTFYHPEIMFSSQGAKYSYSRSRSSGGRPYLTTRGETKVSLNYLNLLPLSLKIYLDKEKDINLIFGPQFGLLLSAWEKGEYNGNEVDENLSEQMKTIDVAAVAGLGFDCPFGLNIGARLNYGLTDISDLSKDYTTGITRPNLTNVVFQFHLGYTFKK